MSRHSPGLENETRILPSPPTQVTLSYFALFLFTLFAISFSLAVIPGRVSLANFRALIDDGTFLRGLGNSALVALAVSTTGLAVASTAGYALSRVRAFRRSPAIPGLFVTQVLPAAILLLPLLFLLFRLGLISPYSLRPDYLRPDCAAILHLADETLLRHHSDCARGSRGAR